MRDEYDVEEVSKALQAVHGVDKVRGDQWAIELLRESKTLEHGSSVRMKLAVLMARYDDYLRYR